MDDLNQKSEKRALENIKLPYKSHETVNNLFKDYYLVVSVAKDKAKYGKGLKIWTLKQMIERLPTALAHIKAGNTSQNLLNKIR